MSKKRQPPAHFPVALFQLDPENAGYDKGKRFRVDTVDETCFYFKSQPAAEEFMRIHGMRHVEASEVEQLRRVMRTQPVEWPRDEDISSEDEGPMA